MYDFYFRKARDKARGISSANGRARRQAGIGAGDLLNRTASTGNVGTDDNNATGEDGEDDDLDYDEDEDDEMRQRRQQAKRPPRRRKVVTEEEDTLRNANTGAA